ncbi:MAG: hypothetical protein AB3N63_03160 [Puniceicoccaceae bacterium]
MGIRRSSSIAYASILGGIMIHLAVFTVIRVQGPAEREQFKQPAEIHFMGNLDEDAKPEILQQAALLDSAPLFMPTQWNPVSEMSEVASLRGATELFAAFPAELQLPSSVPPAPGTYANSNFSADYPLPAGPAFVLSRMGQVRPNQQRLPSPGSTVVIEQLDSASATANPKTILPAELQQQAPPALWTPVSFYFQLSDGWPAGLPVLAQSSGFPDWDDSLQSYVSTLGFYRNLADGYYRLSVFP